MLIDELASLRLFDGLTRDQLAELIAGSAEIRIEPGVDLFREGEHADYWWVLLDGAMDLVRHVGREDTVVRKWDAPGHWAGGFRAFDEHGVYLATGRGATAGRVLRVPAAVLRDRLNDWFPLGRHLIEGLYGTARSIESTVRQRESLVTLGKLAAGLAHEINNPAAATARAVDALETTCQTLLASLARLANEEISAQQFAAIDTLRLEAGPQVPVQDPLILADHEDALSAWLSRHGIDREWIIAPPLAAAGIDVAWCERAAAVLEGPALEAGLEWVASTFSVATLLSDIKESNRRISGLVAAVRSYSQMDRASMQRMDGEGTLRLVTRAEEDDVVIEVGDTGSGMPPEVAARAFETFYTTKEAGKGTGLGLDIAQRIIVERHGGTITIDSQPGNTVLRVRIPARPHAARGQAAS